MKEWTKKEKTRVLDKADEKELQQLHSQIARSKWREKFHVQTVTGLMNDPNGFSYYNGKWHLFYQWFPYGAVHGNKHWYHVTSSDLVHWQNEGIALKPDIKADNNGCFSGSAFECDGKLYLTYTGNNRDAEWNRHPYQLQAVMGKDGTINKYLSPIIKEQAGYTEHQRDPKLLFDEKTGYYYILMGAQRNDQTGTFILYRSKDVHKDWEFYGELKVEGFDDFGYMVECPDIEKIGDDWLLLFSPQGLKPEGDAFQNKFNNVYLIGQMDFASRTFRPADGKLRELDRGFDFYAAQCAYQEKEKDQAYLEAWFGCSDYHYPPSEEEGWVGLQTLARVLTIENGRLMQRPVKAAEEIKGEVLFEAVRGEIKKENLMGRVPDAAVYEIRDPEDESLNLNLYATNLSPGFAIEYDHNRKILSIDRSGMHHQLNTEFGTVRRVYLENGLNRLDIYQDHSSIEIFVNDGEYVLSSRVFPEADEHKIRMGGKDITVTIYEASSTVQDDFKIF